MISNGLPVAGAVVANAVLSAVNVDTSTVFVLPASLPLPVSVEELP
jgi:hypothetical protein